MEPTQQSPYDALGGERVRALAMRFYDSMEAHEPDLTRVHALDAEGRITAETREHFASFLAFWLGGPQGYLETRGHPRLRMRHAHVPIGEELRDAWLRSMARAMDELEIQGPVRSFLDARFAHTADFLRNAPGGGG